MVEQVIGRPDISVVSNPEFLREGTAVLDSLNPDRIVVGADDTQAAAKVGELFASTGAPLIVTDATTSETIKYASNAFLATKLSFVNALAGSVRGGRCRRARRHARAGLRQAHRFRVPAPGAGLGRLLPAQGHPGPAPHRPRGRVRLLAPGRRHRVATTSSSTGWSPRSRPPAAAQSDGRDGGRVGPHLQGQHRRPARLAQPPDLPSPGRPRGHGAGLRPDDRRSGGHPRRPVRAWSCGPTPTTRLPAHRRWSC